MADLRQPVMEDIVHTARAHEVDAESLGQNRDFLRRSIFRSLQSEKRRSILGRAVEVEIIPRLLLAHRRRQTCDAPAADCGHPAAIAHFAGLLIGKSDGAATAHIHAIHRCGIALETIYLTLLRPTARFLKKQWLEDERDFAEVTLGLWQLQQLLREFSATFGADRRISTGLRVLLAPGSADRQDLGYLMFDLVLIAEFFRRDGWEAWVDPASGPQDLPAAVRTEWFDVVQLVVSGDKPPEEIAATIKSVRDASLNRSLGIIVGGPIFVERPELALRVGGDMSAADPKDGASQAQNLVRAIASHE